MAYKFINLRKASKWLLIMFFAISVSFVSCKGKKQNNINKETQLTVLAHEIEKDPKNPELYYKRATLLLNMNKANDALSDINKAIQLDEKNPDYYVLLSDIYFTMVQIQKCNDALKKALEYNENHVPALLKLAELNLYLKNYKQTYEFTDKVIANDNINAKAFFIKGYALKEDGDTVKAVQMFTKAVDLNPDYYDAFMQLGLLYAIKGDNMAVQYYNGALNLNAKSTEAHYALGMFYQSKGDVNNARKSYQNLLTIDPHYKWAHYNLGFLELVFTDKYDLAVQHFSNAIKCDPNYAEAYYNRGYSYELMGKVAEARADYKKALDLKVNYEKAIEGMNRLDKR